MKQIKLTQGLPYQTLHGHTLNSDGNFTYSEFLDECEKNHIGLCAFTDHDFIPGEKELVELNRLKNHNVKYIIGTELSCTPPVGDKTIHLVGLFFDPNHVELKSYLLNQANMRKERFEKIIENFEKAGFKINNEHYDETRKKNNLTLPDAKELIFSISENKDKILNDYKEFLNAQDHTELEKQLIKKVEKRINGWDILSCIFYDIYMSDGNRLSLNVEVAERATLHEASTMIRSAGGVSIFAHYSYGGVELGKELFEKLALEKVFDGIEVVYGMNEKDYNQRVFDDMEYMLEVSTKYNLIKSGGADIHTLSDMQFFVSKQAKERLAEKSKYLIQEILEMKDIDLKYSSID